MNGTRCITECKILTEFLKSLQNLKIIVMQKSVWYMLHFCECICSRSYTAFNEAQKFTWLFEGSKILFSSPTAHISVMSKERRKYWRIG